MCICLSKWGSFMKNRKITVVLIICIMLIAVEALSLGRSYQKKQDDRRISIIFIAKRTPKSHNYWSEVEQGMKLAALEYNIDLTIIGPPSETDIWKQNKMIEEAIEKRPDVIILAPGDYTQTLPYAEKVEEAGIKLLLLDSVMEEQLGSGVVATNNYEGGYKMGAYLQKYSDETSVIGIVAHAAGASTAIERESGVRAGLGAFENQIVEIIYCDSDREKGETLTLELLERRPEINMLIGLNEDSSRGAASAVKKLERFSEIYLVGFDSSKEQVQFLEEGIFDALVVQKPLNMGYLGIQTANQMARGEKIPESIDSGSVLITKDEIYTKENEKLLFPFR